MIPLSMVWLQFVQPGVVLMMLPPMIVVLIMPPSM